ncbi:hypothetical protein CRYUN_Cryun19dG0055600 [Craigia yunnanensis]
MFGGIQEWRVRLWQCNLSSPFSSPPLEMHLDFLALERMVPERETDCTEAINLDKKNVKAYLRRGTAREMLGYYKEAIEGEFLLCIFRFSVLLSVSCYPDMVRMNFECSWPVWITLGMPWCLSQPIKEQPFC